MQAEYEAHPYADLFPQMLPEEWETFLADVHEHGVQMPITLFDGKILDGRHRWQAVQQLAEQGVTVFYEFIEFKGTDAQALHYTYSANVHRRHLTTTMRGTIGVTIKHHVQETLKQGQRTDLTCGNIATSSNEDRNPAARDIAAKMVNVGSRTIDKCEKILEEAPDLFERMKAGELPLVAAENALAIRNGTQTPAQAVKAVAEVIVEAIGKDNLTERNLERAASILTGGHSSAHVSNNSGILEWYTPPAILEAARLVLGQIALDPASSDIAQETVLADSYYTMDNDGLSHQWAGTVWLNPPYTSGIVDKFTAKLCEHYNSGLTPAALVLVNNATDTAWFQHMADNAVAICFPSGRVKFLDPDGKPGAPLQGQAILYFGECIEKFCAVFARFGFCVQVSR